MSYLPHLLTAENELEGLRRLLEHILKSGQRNGVYVEVLSCLLSMEFHQNRWEDFCSLQREYLAVGGDLCRKGWERATRVYTSRVDKPSKPSYLNRLIAFPDKPRKGVCPGGRLNQIEKISEELAKKPGFSNLSFVILRPADLHDQFRPGYVPCALAGDFKCRGGKIDLNVMFRTSDALTVGYADIFYMRRLQMQVLDLAQRLNPSLSDVQVGLLNMYLCRSYIQKAGISKTGARMNGLKIAEDIIRLLRGQNVVAPESGGSTPRFR